MKKINLNLFKSTDKASLSYKGIFLFKDKKNNLLYVGKSGNIHKRISFFLQDSDNSNLSWTKNIEFIEYEIMNSYWELLLFEKKYLKENHPLFQNTYNIFDNYVYLGINYSEKPYFFTREDTQKNDIYLGPFRSRFEMTDIIDVFKIIKASHDKMLCDIIESDWQKFIENWILKYPKKKLNKLKLFIEELEDNLEFRKAENWKKYLNLIKKFYNYLNIFTEGKYLNITWEENNQSFTVKNGLLTKIISKEKKYYWNYDEIEYRDIEKLAIEKSTFDEMWIIINHLKNKGIINNN